MIRRKLSGFLILAMVAACLLAPDAALAEKPLARDIGLILLSQFQCVSKGDATRSMLASAQSTLAMAKDITQKNQQCSQLTAALDKIPSIETIAARVEADNEVTAIEEQERLISEALVDMNEVAAIPPGDPRRDLYPDEALLKQTIQSARAQLVGLRAKMGVDRLRKERERRVSGVQQLDAAFAGLKSVMSNSAECLNTSPTIARSISAGILGIAGYFLQSPVGLAASVSGRLLQHVFSFSNTPENDVKNSFDALDRTQLVSGIGCAFESLGRQHCQLVRQESLTRTILAAEKNFARCDRSDLTLEDQLSKVIADTRGALDSVAVLQDWVAGTNRLTGDPSQQVELASTKSGYDQYRAASWSGLINLEKRLKGIQAQGGNSAEMRRNGVLSSIATLSSLLSMGAEGGIGGGGGGGRGGGDLSLISTYFDSNTQKADFLFFLFPNAEDRDRAYEGLRALQQDQQRAMMGGQGGSMGGEVNSPAPGAGRIGGMGGIGGMGALAMYQSLSQMNPDKPVIKMIADRLGSVSFDELRQRIIAMDQIVNRNTQTSLSNEQLETLMNHFKYGKGYADDQLSPETAARNLIRIVQTWSSSVPENLKRRVNLDGFESKVAGLLDDYKAIDAKKGASAAELQKAKSDFMTEMAKVVGNNQELNDRLQAYMYRAQNEVLKQQVEHGSSAAAVVNGIAAINYFDPDSLSSFTQNTGTPSQQQADLATAKALSVAQISGLTDFLSHENDIVKRAVDFLQDANSKDTDPAIREALSDGKLRNLFCMQSLAMSRVPGPVRDLCIKQNAQIGTPPNVITFASQIDRDYSQRACVLQNFTSLEKRARSR